MFNSIIQWFDNDNNLVLCFAFLFIIFIITEIMT